MIEPADESAIAIIGMSGRFPGAQNIDQLWENLKAGRESLSSLTDADLLGSGVAASEFSRSGYVKATMNVEGAELFDADFFGFRPGEADRLDPQKRLFLECAWEAIEDAGQNLQHCGLGTAVFAGSGASPYFLRNVAQLAGSPNFMERFQAILDIDKDHLTTQTSYKLDLRGPSVAVQTACSTSLVAVHLACQSLLNMECDLALAGGVSLRIHNKGHRYEEGGILSSDGHCRAFDADATGTIFGSGIGVVALKRLESALEDRDPIWAVIRGSAINNDGSYKAGYTAPSHNGQMKVVAAALSAAGVHARQIGLIEAHGTGTVLGDAVELAALTEVFQSQTKDARFCAIGSIKSNIGHLDTAAGVAGLIKAVLCLKHRRFVPSLNYSKPNEVIASPESPFYVNTQSRDWTDSAGPRFAGVSSFGIGGTNAHLILEEFDSCSASEQELGQLIFPVSAKTPEALERMSRNLAEHIASHETPALTDIAYTLGVGRVPFECRRFVIAGTPEDAITQLQNVDARRTGYGFAAGDVGVAFLFPGQAAQYRGFLGNLYRTDSDFKREIDRCAHLFEREGFDHVLDYLCGDDAAGVSERDARFIDQPAQFTSQYCLGRYLINIGIKPGAVLGYSVGEYAAACVSGVLTVQDAVRLVATRTRAMDASMPGSMLIAEAAEDELSTLLTKGVDLAGVNGVQQCVLSGMTEPLKEIAVSLDRLDVPYRWLEFDRAFHSHLMDDAARTLSEVAATLEFREPKIPYLSSYLGTWIRRLPEPDYWGHHLRRTVQFSTALHELAKKPAQILLEIGPGETLVNLARQELGSDISSMRSLQRGAANDRSDMLRLIGTLWLMGAQIDWSCLHAGELPRRTRLPTYPFERAICGPAIAEREIADPDSKLAMTMDDDRGTAPPARSTDLNEDRVLMRPADMAAVSFNRYLKSGSPDYLVPSSASLNLNDSAPPNIKLARSTLSNRAQLPAYLPPDSTTAEAIASVWSDVLNIDQIGLDDNFFDLGGDSQRAMQIIRRVRERLNCKCSMRFIYEDPVLRGFVGRVEQAIAEGVPERDDQSA